jgi:hypothetical protein
MAKLLPVYLHIYFILFFFICTYQTNLVYSLFWQGDFKQGEYQPEIPLAKSKS